MTPSTGQPSSIIAISVPKIGRPAMKLVVPSIGSSTHVRPVSPGFAPYSSPTIPSRGHSASINRRIAASAARSASVTGEASALSSSAKLLRNSGRIAAPAASARAWASMMSAGRIMAAYPLRAILASVMQPTGGLGNSSPEPIKGPLMHARSLCLAALALVAAPTGAQAKGCIRGAIAGGVAGHYAGHHGLIGAAGGCMAGRAYYKHKAKAESGGAATHDRRPERTLISRTGSTRCFRRRSA